MAENYEIVSQVPKTRSQPGGVIVQVVDVTFRTKPSGQIGIVEVPATMYAVDEVHRLVAAHAAKIEEVQHL